MSVKYWCSPFPIESSLSEALHDAGIARQPWKSIDAIKQSELTILFDPPDLVLSRRADKKTTTNPNDLDLVDLSILIVKNSTTQKHISIFWPFSCFRNLEPPFFFLRW